MKPTYKRVLCSRALLTLISFVFAATQGQLTAEESAAKKEAPLQPKLMSYKEVFEFDRLLDVNIEIAESDWNKLRHQSRNFATALLKPPPPSPYTWFKANVTINGKRIENVGVRKKGFIGSQDSQRPSLKIKFDEFEEGQDPIEDVDRLTLNNNKQDRGFISQMLTYKLFREAGLPSSRCTLAKVSINGESLGIYTNVESVKKPMLEKNFGDANGKLYEGTVADLFADKVDALEAKTTDEKDKREELLSVAKLVDGKGELDLAELEKHLDVDSFLKFWALESLIGFWDGYTNNQNNYFVYFHKEDSKLHFMPWGADAAFSYSGGAKMFKSGPESVHGKSLLANRLYKAEGVADRYRETMRELLEGVWDEEAICGEIDRIEKLVEGSLHASQEDSTEAMEDSREFVNSRRKRIERELKDWPQQIPRQPRKPFYSDKVGEATGKFTTKWFDKDPKEPYDTGTAELELTIDGKPVKFLRLGVYAKLGDRGMGDERPPTVVFAGKRKSNKIKVTFAVGTDREAFENPNGEPTAAMGGMFEGVWVFGMRILGGTITLDEAGLEPGDTVRGSFKVDVVQFKGDMR